MLFGSSGIRRKYGDGFVELAMAAGYAVGYHSKSLVVGMDSRTTGPLLARAFSAGALSKGCSVSWQGIEPSPTVAFNARFHDAGCMVTASHNPEEYNGLKLFNPDGSSFIREQQQATEELIESDTRELAGWEHQGSIIEEAGIARHATAIQALCTVPEGIQVILDCANGAGSVITPSLLASAGARVTAVHASPSGWFSRPSEPLPEYVPYIRRLMDTRSAGCAILHDGDADRMMAFDNRGRFIDGDRMLALFARYLGAGKVVTTYDASMLIEEFAETKRTPVGDAYVSEKLRSWGDFGGEPSGAWVFPRLSLCPDGPHAAALFCEMAGEWDIAAEIDAMPTYSVIRESIVHKEAKAVMEELGAENPTDGVRTSGEQGWCLIRASGTEPKIRITVEGKTVKDAKGMMEDGKERLSRAFRSLKEE
jgi:phosphoglucosamine mutase